MWLGWDSFSRWFLYLPWRRTLKNRLWIVCYRAEKGSARGNGNSAGSPQNTHETTQRRACDDSSGVWTRTFFLSLFPEISVSEIKVFISIVCAFLKNTKLKLHDYYYYTTSSEETLNKADGVFDEQGECLCGLETQNAATTEVSGGQSGSRPPCFIYNKNRSTLSCVSGGRLFRGYRSLLFALNPSFNQICSLSAPFGHVVVVTVFSSPLQVLVMYSRAATVNQLVVKH